MSLIWLNILCSIFCKYEESFFTIYTSTSTMNKIYFHVAEGILKCLQQSNIIYLDNKQCVKILISNLDLVWLGCFGVFFFGISTIERYLMPDPLYILNIYDLVWLGFMACQPL